MRILIIKLSSIGDLIHTFPAVVDAKNNIQNLQIDWLVDQQFVEIIKLQQDFFYNNQIKIIDKIISIPLRKFKLFPCKTIMQFPIKAFIKNLQIEKYDLVIDAQGLLKSAIIARLVRGIKTYGFDFDSCREPLASFFYNYKIKVSKEQHAIDRTRELFAKSLGYQYNPKIINYGLDRKKFSLKNNIIPAKIKKYIVFLHGTTWETKHWAPEYWIQLAQLLQNYDLNIVIMTNDPKQQIFANQIAATNPKIIILSELDFLQVAIVISNASAIIAVDTGFAHLAVSLGVPSIGIYGATSVVKAGLIAFNSINLRSEYHCSPCLSKLCLEYKYGRSKIKQPCYQEITPEIVMQSLSKLQIV